MGLFSRSDKRRRNSDDKAENMQYWTPRGAIPAKVANVQAQEVSYYNKENTKRYPKVYKNDEINRSPPFEGYERMYDEKRQYIEVPILSRMDFDKKASRVEQVRNRDIVHHGDRARVAQRDLNDPGPFRAIVPRHSETGRTYGVAGVLYHPENDPRAFERAPQEPMDRNGRRFLRRYEDDCSHGNRVDTWPPRDEDGDDLARYEVRHRQVRKSVKK